jgi:hypothetical protein
MQPQYVTDIRAPCHHTRRFPGSRPPMLLPVILMTESVVPETRAVLLVPELRLHNLRCFVVGI